MIQQTTLTKARAAGGADKFITMANFVAALTAFDGSVDQLKHAAPFKNALVCGWIAKSELT
jgi:hypothetical protein